MEICKKIISILKRKKLKISFAESCTGGLLSSSITSISGSSKVFSTGLVTYSNEAKHNILKVPKIIIKKHGAVSEVWCAAMVNNLSKITKSKVNVSVTVIAGPKGGSYNKPVGLVFIGIKINNVTKIVKFKFKNKNRKYIQKQTVKTALKLILRGIL